MFSPEECQRSLQATERKLVLATLDFTLTRQKLKRLTADIEKFKGEVGRLSAMLAPALECPIPAETSETRARTGDLEAQPPARAPNLAHPRGGEKKETAT